MHNTWLVEFEPKSSKPQNRGLTTILQSNICYFLRETGLYKKFFQKIILNFNIHNKI